VHLILNIREQAVASCDVYINGVVERRQGPLRVAFLAVHNLALSVSSNLTYYT
jgi:hypothetical protein